LVRIGVISDTHDWLRPSAVEALQGVDHILHVGDVCQPKILGSLQELAPLNAVRGNMDLGSWAQETLPVTDAIELGGCWIYMIHDLDQLDVDPDGRFQVVLHGHTHMPEIREDRGVLFFNPGSAGARRAGRPISLGFLEIHDGIPSAEWIEISET
jgi:hypothetical protein